MSAASTTADLEETPVPSEPTRPLPRRTMLAVSGTAVLAAAAACSSGTAAPGTTATPSSASSSPSASSARAGAATSASSASTPPTADATTPAPSSATAGPAEPTPSGTPVASVADVQAAGSVVVEATDGPLLLAFSDGTVVAHTAVCTHQQCTIAASGMCPCHGSRFNVTTGAVENGPALRPLAQQSVTVSGGQVYLT